MSEEPGKTRERAAGFAIGDLVSLRGVAYRVERVVGFGRGDAVFYRYYLRRRPTDLTIRVAGERDLRPVSRQLGFGM